MTRSCMGNDASDGYINPDWACPQIPQFPLLPQAQYGKLDLSILDGTNSDIVVRVTQWHNYAQGDDVVAYFDNIRSYPRVLSGNDSPPFDVLFKTSEIPDGEYLVWFALHKPPPISNCSHSQPVLIKVTGSGSKWLGSPIFLDAINKVISYQSIQAEQGTRIRTNYPSIARDDRVSFYWRGHDAGGNDVPSASYFAKDLNVTSVDCAQGYLEYLIPAKYLEAVGDKGGMIVHYTVQSVTGTLKTSLTSQVTIDWDNATQLQITSTTDAVILSDDFPHIKPYNHVSVCGTPGLAVTASVSLGGAIAEADGDTVYTTQLDAAGRARFRVSSTDVAQVTVAVYSSPQIGSSAVCLMNFFAYRQGSAGIDAYCYTTHTPSDNTTPCSIYLIVDPALTTQKVHVEVSGNARINHVLAAIDIPPNPDGTATVNIYDKQTENVTATLYVPGQSGSSINVPMEFIQFPTA